MYVPIVHLLVHLLYTQNRLKDKFPDQDHLRRNNPIFRVENRQ